jgi:hypothetical protein
MSEFEDYQQFLLDFAEDDGLSAVDLSNSLSKNKRVAPRYVRDDIVVVVCEMLAFSLVSKEIFIDFVKLNDITSRGLSFSSPQYMAIRKKIILNLKFYHSKTSFKISAMIVYRSDRPPYQYGVKFDYDNHELSDHLLETQRNLVFK